MSSGIVVSFGFCRLLRSMSGPQIAMPTTYAGSEMTQVLGITDATERKKRTVSDPSIMPRVVLYDPEATVGLPPGTTASSRVQLAPCP